MSHEVQLSPAAPNSAAVTLPLPMAALPRQARAGYCHCHNMRRRVVRRARAAMANVRALPSASLPSWGGLRCGYQGEYLGDSGAPVRRRCVSLDIREEALALTALDEHAAAPL